MILQTRHLTTKAPWWEGLAIANGVDEAAASGEEESVLSPVAKPVGSDIPPHV